MTITEVPPPEDEGSPQSQNNQELTTRIRRVVFGQPLESTQSETTTLRKLLALPIYCSDGISSVAYGNQAILLVLCSAGLWLPSHSGLYATYMMTISWIILGLLTIVAASYWQTIFTYTNGGGSYIVSKDNLGETPGLIAAAALLIDYVLTVSVSVASGLQNLENVPLFASWGISSHLVLYCCMAIGIITFANLRGLKESGSLFAIPVYTFIGMCYLLIIVGILGPFVGWHFHTEFANQVVPSNITSAQKVIDAFSMIILLRAFANGCSAMTGTEAVSNGIPSFKEPRSKNAAMTLIFMALILGSIFMGVSYLAVHFHVVYWEHNGVTAPAVIDQLSGTVFGKEGPFSWAYLLTQISTALILIIAAQTSFAGFPRLASILATDGYLPRQLTALGDRLAFNNGIFLLGIFSSLLIIVEKGSVDALIPFFAIGVFVAFTMSQSGMVRHWFKVKSKGWQHKSVINGLGAIACFIVVIDIAAEKFFEGAWFVIVVIFALLFTFKKIHKHYARMAQLLLPSNYMVAKARNKVIVLVQSVHAGSLAAVDYGRSICKNCIAVSVAIDPEGVPRLKEQWEKYVPGVELVILDSPYRSLVEPITHFVDEELKAHPGERVTVVIPEFVTTKWWQTFLHGHTGFLLKLALLGHRDVVVANVRYWLEGS
jgi:amino acid transporter